MFYNYRIIFAKSQVFCDFFCGLAGRPPAFWGGFCATSVSFWGLNSMKIMWLRVLAGLEGTRPNAYGYGGHAPQGRGALHIIIIFIWLTPR